MSSQPETPAEKPSDTPATTDTTTSETKETPAPTLQTKPMKKVKSKKDLKDDPSRFEAPGINFNAKLIGIDDVEAARGDKMCQDAMSRLKMAVRQSGQHKQKIIINVSLDGIRIMDLRSQATNHTHAVHRISFISRDVTDARAFGYVYGAGEGKHKFYAIKTDKAAEALVLSLRDLFQAVYEKKKREVEEAKHKIEEPAEKADEAKENQEPVYQVPTSKPVENGSEPTYQVPPNNKPVEQETTADLLNLENELHSMEQRIEQIDTMEELFKELEAPPPASSHASNTTSSTSWASSLAGLATPPQQAQSMFSMGGSPFPQSHQAFPPTSQAFPPTSQNQPFGAPAQSMFGGTSQQSPFGFQQQGPQTSNSPFGAPFQPPSVPPRSGMGFPAQSGGFLGTPFPGTQQPAFPPVGQQPSVVVTPANDPFGNDPFAGSNTDFEEVVLMPVRKEIPLEEAPKPQKKDAFGDLVSLGDSSKQAKSPKEMFVEVKQKKSLNDMKKGERSPSPKPVSPSGFQASDPFGMQPGAFK